MSVSQKPPRAFVQAVGILIFLFTLTAYSQRSVYDELKSFSLSGGSVQVTDHVMKVDRVTMSFTGTFYLTSPVGGKNTGAVFTGKGTFVTPVPDNTFEKANVRRLLKSDAVQSDFSQAVIRTTDGSLDALAANAAPGPASADIQNFAAEADERMRKENGVNIAGRLSVSIQNKESAGVFVATFRGGKMDEFSYVFDPQNRIPTAFFDINGGEKGLIFAYKGTLYSSEVLTAFYSLSDYERGVVQYSDLSDLVDITAYDIDLDLRSPKSKVVLRSGIRMKALADGIRSIPFNLGESLSRYEDERLKKQLRVSSVRYGDSEIDFAQEDWEGGFTVFLPAELKTGDELTLEMTMQGDFLEQPSVGSAGNFSYPRSTTTWYPRHGYLDRANYSIVFTHSKRLKVVCVGNRVAESPSPDDKDYMVSQYKMDHPIALATFALGPFVRHNEKAKWDGTDETLPLEFNSVDGAVMSLKESFVLAELSNSVRYFHKLFGKYPYETYSASFHPYGFGQGFPSMLMIPRTDSANKNTYAFVAHETGHQWWGNIVAWRSYRDQWLSEGFAEYSGVLYTGLRDSPKASVNLIENMRATLRQPPQTLSGQGKGKLNDVGPIILGHRLSTSKTFGGYQTLVYNKGALVLRMLHFLFTDPASGSGEPFFEMMRDFVERHRNGTASTDDFRAVANEHFIKTPIAKRYGVKDLNWFFQQWVYESNLPSYTMVHSVEMQPDGSAMLTGEIIQENVPDNFFMPLPVLIKFGGDKIATGTVAALGPKTPFKIKLPQKPQKVELDPNNWILSEKTSTK